MSRAANSKSAGPDLTKYMDKSVIIHLSANRKVSGIQCGFDDFMNIVLDNTTVLSGKTPGQTVGKTVIRGDSIKTIEATEPISITNYAPKVR